MNGRVVSFLSGRVIQEPTTPERLEMMRQRAWREQGFLSVSVIDKRLSLDQQEFLRQIAEQFYGKRERDRA